MHLRLRGSLVVALPSPGPLRLLGTHVHESVGRRFTFIAGRIALRADGERQPQSLDFTCDARRRLIEKQRDESSKARAHLDWQFEIPHNPHSPLGVPRVMATLANDRSERIPTCSVFFVPPKIGGAIPLLGKNTSGLESKDCDGYR